MIIHSLLYCLLLKIARKNTSLTIFPMPVFRVAMVSASVPAGWHDGNTDQADKWGGKYQNGILFTVYPPLSNGKQE
jgi:hypothetical protein